MQEFMASPVNKAYYNVKCNKFRIPCVCCLNALLLPREWWRNFPREIQMILYVTRLGSWMGIPRGRKKGRERGMISLNCVRSNNIMHQAHRCRSLAIPCELPVPCQEPHKDTWLHLETQSVVMNWQFFKGSFVFPHPFSGTYPDSMHVSLSTVFNPLFGPMTCY